MSKNPVCLIIVVFIIYSVMSFMPAILSSSASGMINEILPVKEVIQRIVEGYEQIIATLA